MKAKKIIVSCLTATMLASLFSGCGSSSSKKEIYFLNFKPEGAEIYDKIVAEYKKETGVEVKVVTAASGKYEETLRAEIAKSNPPTIFQMNGPVGYQNWKDYCLDLKDTELYSYLLDPSLAITNEGGVYGIPYVMEGYGIIYNEGIMSKYFALPDKAVSINATTEINNFELLSQVVEDMTAHKEELGIEGVFASTSLSTGEAWRWQTHLANMPFYYEFKENTNFDNTILAGLDAKEVEFKYSENYKNLFDLYLNNSCTAPNMLSSKSVNDSMAEFALGEVAMVQNGTWAWNQIKGVEGNMVKPEEVKYLPLYTGMPDEENQGLCIGTENYLAINSKVSEEKQQMSIDFLKWLFSSETGKKYVSKELGFSVPFNTFNEDERPEDPLAQEVSNWMNKGVNLVPWSFTSFPSENFKTDFENLLLEYAQGQKEWDAVVDGVKEAWKTEAASRE